MTAGSEHRAGPTFRPALALLAAALALLPGTTCLARAGEGEAGAAPASERRVVLTGAVRSTDAETIYAPIASASPVVLRQLVAEGSTVAPGDVLVRVDPGAAAAQITSLKAQIALARARIAKELAELEVRRIDAALALVDAEAALARAEVDAAIPAQHLARIDFDRYQGEAERARRERRLKEEEQAAAITAVERRRRDGELELRQLETDLAFAERQIAQAEQRATRAGTVIFGFHPWSGQRYQEGLSANAGTAIGEVVGPGELAVRAFAHEVDRPALALDQPVAVAFDALPGQRLGGRIKAISGAPEPKAEWGPGRYFTVDVALEDAGTLPLRPGMSARVDSRPGPVLPPSPSATAGPLRLEGEIAARRSAAIAPPAVDGQWQFQITQLVPDGSPVKAGQVVVAFDAGEVQRRLQEAEGRRNEKRSERERLLLDLAEREKTERLSLEEQRAELGKSERKAAQPAGLLRSVEYRKLVIDCERAGRRLALFEQRHAAGEAQRRAERALVEAELAQYTDEVARLGAALAALQVRAPRDGVLVMRSSWRGERFEIGSQVFVGQAVAEIPDPATLVVRATAAERDLLRLRVGAPARVRIEGGAGRQLEAEVVRIGAAVRSKSRRQPIPVVDVELELRGDATGLKPGQAVSVELETRGVGA